jgi:hypothetical protein
MGGQSAAPLPPGQVGGSEGVGHGAAQEMLVERCDASMQLTCSTAGQRVEDELERVAVVRAWSAVIARTGLPVAAGCVRDVADRSVDECGPASQRVGYGAGLQPEMGEFPSEDCRGGLGRNTRNDAVR